MERGAAVLVVTLAAIVLFPHDIRPLLLATACILVGLYAYRAGAYLLAILSGALLFRIAIILFDSWMRFIPHPPIMDGHNQRASAVASAWAGGDIGLVSTATDPMRLLVAHVLAPFYLVFGGTPVAGRIGLAMISLALGYVVYRLATSVASRRTALLATGVSLFWPTVVYRSIVIQRELLNAVALLVFVWAAFRWLDRVSVRAVLIAATAATVVVTLRAENLLLLAVVVGAVFVARGRKKPRFLLIAGLVSIPLLGYFLLNFGDITGYGSVISPAAIDAFAHGRSHGSAAYLVNLHYRTWLDVVLYTPTKVLYFLFTPFLWDVRGIAELVTSLSAFLLLATTTLLPRGIRRLRKHPDHLTVILTYLFVGVVGYSVIEMNYGAAVRRRILFVPLIVLVAAVGLSNVRFRIREEDSDGPIDSTTSDEPGP